MSSLGTYNDIDNESLAYVVFLGANRC